MINFSRYNTRLLFLIILLAILNIPQTVSTTIWPKYSLLYRIMKANFVVVGSLTNVKKNAILITQKDYNGKDFHVHLDSGMIQATKVLYAPQGMKMQDIRLPFASYSRSQPQPSGYQRSSSSFIYFDEGDEGIWFLNSDQFTNHTVMVSPYNLLPIDSLSVVEKTIEDLLKIAPNR